MGVALHDIHTAQKRRPRLDNNSLRLPLPLLSNTNYTSPFVFPLLLEGPGAFLLQNLWIGMLCHQVRRRADHHHPHLPNLNT
jgi:hypothetical protein